MLTMQAKLCTPGAAVAVAAGKLEAEEWADVGDITNEAEEGPARTVGARSRLVVAMAAAPKPRREVLQWATAIGVARKAIGRSTAWRSYVADAKDGGTVPMPAPRPRRINADDTTDRRTLLMSAPHRNK